MRFRIKLILLIFLLTFTKLTAFKPAVELEKQLDTAKGIYRVDILNELSEMYELDSYSKALQYSNLAFLNALKINYPEGMSIALSRMLIESTLSLPPVFASQLKSTLIFMFNNSDNPSVRNELSNGLGMYYSLCSDFESASRYFLISLSIYEKYKLQNKLSSTYENIGWFYKFIYDYENSAENYKKAIDIYNPKSKQILHHAKMLYGIETMFEAGNDSMANFYLNKLLPRIKSNSDSIVLGLYYRISGKIEIKNKNYEKAIEFFQKSKLIFIDLESTNYLADVYTLIAHVWSLKQNYSRSLQNNKLALEQRIMLGPERNIVSSLINIGIDYYSLERYDDCIPILKKASEISIKYNMHHYYTRSNEWLYKTYYKLNNIDSAYSYFEEYISYQNLIKLIENNRNTIKFQLKSELEKKDRDLVEMALDKEKNKNFYILIIVALIIIIAIVLYIRFRQKHKINLILTDKNIMLEEANKNISAKENALSELNSELDNLVKERTKHLDAEIKQRIMAEENIIQLKDNIQSAYEKEKELNIMKTRFMSMISHEFRTPLTVIVSSSDIMKLESENDNSEKIQKQSLKIRNSVKQMTSLIDDVIAFNNTESSTYILRIDEIEICNLIQEIISEQKLTYKSSVNVVCDSNNNPLNMYSDKRILRHILSNLIGNAVKYTPSDKNISVNIKKMQNIVKIQISDQGIGIPPTDMENIWEPFFRGSNIRNISGTGFGLYIVKDFVTKLGGEINITSKINEGTTVSLIVPVKSN
jgi:signal transduction histidine kinase